MRCIDWQRCGRGDALVRDIQFYQSAILQIGLHDKGRHLAPAKTRKSKIKSACQIDESPDPTADNPVAETIGAVSI